MRAALASAVVVAAVVPSLAAAAPRAHWHACADPAQRGLQCATVRAPLSWSRPHGRTIRLAVVRHRATDPRRRIGSLFYNPGGPGGQGTQAVAGLVSTVGPAVAARFDLVSWDPRGVGQSTAVQCFASARREAAFFGGLQPLQAFPVGRAQATRFLGLSRTLGRRCARRNGALLRHVTTADTARDLDLLRRVVGDRRTNYLGYSYGTFLGATYANLFPGRVRRMVLLSNVDPRAWMAGRRPGRTFLPTFLRLGSDLSSARVLGAFLRLCARAGPARCAFAAGSAAATRTKWDALVHRLRAGPRSGLTLAEVLTQTQVGLAGSADWDQLGTFLQDVWTGATVPPPPGPSTAPRYAGPEQALSIACSESPNPGPRGVRRAARIARRRSTPLSGFFAWFSGPCAAWPATGVDRYTGPWDHPTHHPVLVIGDTFDPNTPYRGSRAMARELGRARLLTVDGYGHGAPSPCADRAIARYFVGGRLPAKGARCPQRPLPFAG